MNAQDARHLVNAIESSKYYKLKVWEKRFIKGIKADIAKGVGLSTRQSIKLHEVYRKSQEFFNHCSPTYVFNPGGVVV